MNRYISTKIKSINRSLFIAASLVTMTSCAITDDYFGESTQANITTFTITNQLSSTVTPMVNHADTGVVNIVMPTDTDLTNLTVQNIKYSPLAHSTTDMLAIKDFTNPIIARVIAEDDSYSKIWKITVKNKEIEIPEAGVGPQIDYSTFNVWTKMLDDNGSEISLSDGTIAYTPGDGVRKVWSTTAQANAYTLSGIDYITAYPQPNASNAEYARLETVQSQTAATFAKSGVVASALFTGDFVFNVLYGMPATSAPRKMLNFGTPFTGKPKQLKFDYRYKPGAFMKDGLLQDITAANADGRPLKDSCEVYVILHNRDDANNWVRVGAAWLRDGQFIGDMNDSNSFEPQTIDFVYGKPSAEILKEKPYMNIGGVRGELIFYSFTTENGKLIPSTTPVNETFASDPENTAVTHVTMLVSSSAYGDMFWAATNGEPTAGELRGSTIDIKDIELVY